MLKTLEENVIKYKLPIPIPEKAVYSWAEGIMEREGEIYLYTGALYQLIPYIKKVVGLRFKPSFLSPLAKLLKPDKELKEKVEKILKNVGRRLAERGVAYLFEDDLYSGALLYDLGLKRGFEVQAKRVIEALNRRKVKRVVTLDPHTTYMLKVVYPKLFKFEVDVITYIEFLGLDKLELDGVLHEPCYYARYLQVKMPRAKLPPRHGKLTYCCGGPVESLSLQLARSIAKERFEELRKVSEKIYVACPICLLNLSEFGDVYDVGERA